MIRVIKKELNFWRMREETLMGQISGLDIKVALEHLARRCGIRNRSLYRGCASAFENIFEPYQLKLLYEYLSRIEEAFPRRLDWQAVLLEPNSDESSM
jgi:hypothetical protein